MKRVAVLLAAVTVAGMVAAQEGAAASAAGDGARAPVLMIGDSMMRLLAIEFEKAFRKQDIAASSFSSLGSGLIRLDAFDWFGKVRELMETHKPGTVIVTLGANDNQVLLGDDGNTVPPGSAAWDEAYSARLGKMMDLFAATGAGRVIWIMLPDMREAAHQRFAERFNTLLRNAAKERGFVTLYDPRSPLSRRAQEGYAATVITPEGRAVQVRSADGVHLSKEGAQRVAEAVISQFWK